MNRRQPDPMARIFLLLLVIPVIWAAILAAPLLGEGLPGLLKGLAEIDPARLTWTADTPRIILLFLLAYGLGLLIYASSRKNYRRLEEYGSARWGDPRALCRNYADRAKPMHNKLFTRHVRMSFNGRKHRRNLNTIVVGGSGAGKTRFYAKPNAMQCNTSLVILDPKGEICRDTGYLFEKKGYDVRILDLINMGRSHGYNPLAYIRDANDVLKLVTNLIRNTTPKGSQSNDPFWERAETALLEALILYLIYEAPPEEQNFSTVMEMLAAAAASEEDAPGYESVIDQLFERLAMREPEHIAVKQYAVYKQAPGKTAASINISLAVRLSAFNLPKLAALTAYDELNLPALGERKGVLFAILPDNDSSFNFLIGMLYTQLFQELFHLADFQYGGRLPVHVHFLMDEFSNVALPDEFDKLLAVMRSREISVSIILQNIAQLKALYEKQWESIVGNCDELLYLGGNEPGTHEMISKLLGKESIYLDTYGKSRGRNGSYSTNTNLSGRELLMPDEVRMLDNRKAILFIRGEYGVIDEKYDLMQHPNIAWTVDGGAPPYVHGQAPKAMDPGSLFLTGETGDYEVYSETELQEIYELEDNAS